MSEKPDVLADPDLDSFTDQEKDQILGNAVREYQGQLAGVLLGLARLDHEIARQSYPQTQIDAQREDFKAQESSLRSLIKSLRK